MFSSDSSSDSSDFVWDLSKEGDPPSKFGIIIGIHDVFGGISPSSTILFLSVKKYNFIGSSNWNFSLSFRVANIIFFIAVGIL